MYILKKRNSLRIYEKQLLNAFQSWIVAEYTQLVKSGLFHDTQLASLKAMDTIGNYSK